MDNCNLTSLPIDSADFENLRKLNQIYVDKTDLIFEMVKFHAPFFLSRPRRFGKSLLTTTIKSLFEHGLEYFEDLKISKLWNDSTYPVLYLNFSDFGESDYDFFYDSLLTEIKYFIQNNNIKIDVNIDSIPHPVKLFKKAVTFSDEPIVILIDEYDCQLTHNLNNPELYERFRSLISSFFLSIKANRKKIRFIFITGITRHSNTNIFSGLNNLTDITTFPQYGTLVGFTEEEINHYFAPFIENAAKQLNTSIENIKAELKNNYDGFCFDELIETHVYNPWSVIKFFYNSKIGFKSYWVDSGFSSLVVTYFKSKSKEKNNLDIFRILNAPINLYEEDISSNVKIIDAKPESILYQAGFLTLNEKQVFGFKATVPNFEVRKALSSKFFNMINDSKEVFIDNLDGSFKALLEEGLSTLNIEKIMEGFQCILNNFRPGTNIFAKEIHICDAISGFVHFLDAIVKREDPQLLGDSDLIIYYKNTRYLFEFKIAKDESKAPNKLNEAINQIQEKKYGKNSEPTKLYRFGVVFNLEKRVFCLGKFIEE